MFMWQNVGSLGASYFKVYYSDNFLFDFILVHEYVTTRYRDAISMVVISRNLLSPRARFRAQNRARARIHHSVI